jgi:hypothetical protein
VTPIGFSRRGPAGEAAGGQGLNWRAQELPANGRSRALRRHAYLIGNTLIVHAWLASLTVSLVPSDFHQGARPFV